MSITQDQTQTRSDSPNAQTPPGGTCQVEVLLLQLPYGPGVVAPLCG